LKRRHIRHGRAAPGEIPTSTFPEEERADEKAITSFFRGSIDPQKPLETKLPRKHSSCLAMPHRPRRSFFSRGGIGRRARRRSGGFSASSVACRGERVDAPRGARGAADRVKKDISPAIRARGEHVIQSFPPLSRFMSPPKKLPLLPRPLCPLWLPGGDRHQPGSRSKPTSGNSADLGPGKSVHARTRRGSRSLLPPLVRFPEASSGSRSGSQF